MLACHYRSGFWTYQAFRSEVLDRFLVTSLDFDEGGTWAVNDRLLDFGMLFFTFLMLCGFVFASVAQRLRLISASFLGIEYRYHRVGHSVSHSIGQN